MSKFQEDIEEIKNSCVRTETEMGGLKSALKNTDSKVDEIRQIVTRHDERINQLSTASTNTGNRTWQIICIVASGLFGAFIAKITGKSNP